MQRTLSFQKHLIIFGIPLCIIATMIFLAKSSFFVTNDNHLSIGITYDLLLTVPLVYFFLIRKTRIPKTTVALFFFAGLIICSVLLPPQNHYYLNLFKTWLLPVVEFSIVSYVLFKVGKGIKYYRLNKDISVDFFTALKKTCFEVLPKGVVIPIVTEIAVFYYGFIYWKKRKLNDNEFSYHKYSGTITLLVAIIFIVAIETMVLHILLAKWSIVAAYILTFLSIYSGIQLFGFLKSMYKRPILIENEKLFLRYGIMNETTIDLADIDSIELSSKDLELGKETRKLSFLGNLESHNVVLRLKKENTLIGLYGVERKYRNLAFYVDDKVEFKNRIDPLVKHC